MGVMTMNMAWQRIRWRLLSLVTGTQACFHWPPPGMHRGAPWKSVNVSWICSSEARGSQEPGMTLFPVMSTAYAKDPGQQVG